MKKEIKSMIFGKFTKKLKINIQPIQKSIGEIIDNI